uniref:Uncharacterized protein n=1 Tax=Romanomermis culicivorax TaxID=13658 RepID=A0A915KYJ9_ROMCU
MMSKNSKSPSKAPVPERTVNETVNAAVDASDKLQADITALIRGQTKHQCQEMVRKPGNTSSPTVNNLSNVRKRDKLGNSRLQLSCTSNCEDSALDDVRRFLFEDGINPNERDNNNWTPLHEAACRGHNKIVELLLKSGAVVDAVGGEDCITPLHDAIINGHLETVRILLNFGASTIQRNSQGATSFDMTSDENILYSRLNLQFLNLKYLYWRQGNCATNVYWQRGRTRASHQVPELG